MNKKRSLHYNVKGIQPWLIWLSLPITSILLSVASPSLIGALLKALRVFYIRKETYGYQDRGETVVYKLLLL